MKVNLNYLTDILASMIEGQYLDEQQPAYYQDFIDFYFDFFQQDLNAKQQNSYKQGLKPVLKYLLNNPEVDCNRIFYDAAQHCFTTEDEVREVLSMIWKQFFGHEDWVDETFSAEHVEVFDTPITYNG